MNNNQTVEKLKQMRLSAMADLHLQHVKSNQFNNVTPDEYLALLTDHEWEDRQDKKISRLTTQANFRQKATIAQVSFTENRNLDKNMFNRLSTLDFIKKQGNYLATPSVTKL